MHDYSTFVEHGNELDGTIETGLNFIQKQHADGYNTVVQQRVVIGR